MHILYEEDKYRLQMMLSYYRANATSHLFNVIGPSLDKTNVKKNTQTVKSSHTGVKIRLRLGRSPTSLTFRKK